jgi:trehalose 6-phosphate phosphatase
LNERLADIEGHAIERKAFAIAVHYRRVADADVPRMEKIVDEIVGGLDRLRKGHGKKVFQVQPNTDWDKGHAVRWLMERLDLRPPRNLPVYIGDDITDEDAFQALAGAGINIVVRDGSRNTSADFALADASDVRRFLEFLMQTERQLT